MRRTIIIASLLITLFILAMAIPGSNQETATYTISAGFLCRYENIEITALSETVTLNDTLILKSGERRYFEKLEFGYTQESEFMVVAYNKDGSIRSVWVHKKDAPELQYSFWFGK